MAASRHRWNEMEVSVGVKGAVVKNIRVVRWVGTVCTSDILNCPSPVQPQRPKPICSSHGPLPVVDRAAWARCLADSKPHMGTHPGLIRFGQQSDRRVGRRRQQAAEYYAGALVATDSVLCL